MKKINPAPIVEMIERILESDFDQSDIRYDLGYILCLIEMAQDEED